MGACPVQFFVEKERSVFNWGLPRLPCGIFILWNPQAIPLGLLLRTSYGGFHRGDSVVN